MKSDPVKTPLTPKQVLDLLASRSFYADQIAAVGVEEAKCAEFANPERPMLARLAETVSNLGIHRLYAHQAAAFDLAESRKDCVVCTGTGSGKTLCANLPVLNRLMSEPRGTALYLFPTKALAQDQLRALEALMPEEIRAAVYDGDTPKSKRAAIRKTANILLTNPDMLHVGILPNHGVWHRFLKSLRFILIDELHAYSGVFGSHVALVLRRLLRMCDRYGSRPTIIALSATIRNPSELFESLTGRSAEIVSMDGAPQGIRRLALWNPPPIEGADDRRSTLIETANILAALVSAEVRTLCFSRTRIGAELIYSYTLRILKDADARLAKRVESYRGGYTAKDRRAIEKRLFSGETLGLCATNALELGIDVGSLDVVLMSGYPGTITSLKQQSGRAGRGSKESLAILIAQNNPLDQFLIRKPDAILSAKPEPVNIHPSNPKILAAQLRCAAYEQPLVPTDLERFPENALDLVEELEAQGALSRRSGFWLYPEAQSPAAEVDIRSSDAIYQIQHEDELIGTMEEWRAFENGHKGAVYLHYGRQYLVNDLDLVNQTIHVQPTQCETYTQAIAQTSVLPTAEYERKRHGRTAIALQDLSVTSIVTGYKTRSILSDAVLGVADLDLPARTIETVGLMLDLPISISGSQVETGAVHALEHAALVIAPLVASCDMRDVRSAFYPIWPDTMRPCVFIYDAAPGGSGISQTLFENSTEWWDKISELICGCRCEDGCPSCVLISECPFGNAEISRRAAAGLLKAI